MAWCEGEHRGEDGCKYSRWYQNVRILKLNSENIILLFAVCWIGALKNFIPWIWWHLNARKKRVSMEKIKIIKKFNEPKVEK